MIVNDYSSDNSLNFHNIKYFEQNLKDDLVLSKKTKIIKVYIVFFSELNPSVNHLIY